MTLTEDELARPLTGLEETTIRRGVARHSLGWQQTARLLATLDATRKAADGAYGAGKLDAEGEYRDRLVTPVADTAVPDPGATWCSTCGHERRNHSSGGMCDGDGTECYCVRFPDAPDFADTAGIDAAWQEAEAALPEGWDLFVGHTSECKVCSGWWATASKRLEKPPYYPRIVSSETGRPRGEHHDATPAAALLALAAALRTPKPEGETDHE